MKTIIIYVAADETEFDNKEECQKYEDNLYNLFNKLLSIIRFYDKNGNRLLIRMGRKAWEEDMGYTLLEQAYNESESLEILEDFNKELYNFERYHYGFFFPLCKGKYIWDNKKNTWIK